MRPIATVSTTILAIALGTVAGAAQPTGRVVRIERRSASHIPVLCTREGDDLRCLQQPRVGDTLLELDGSGVTSRMTIESVRPPLGCDRRWHAVPTPRFPHRPDPNAAPVLVIDARIDPEAAHQISDASVVIAGDHDVVLAYARGEGEEPDVVLLRGRCGRAPCYATWERLDETYRRVATLALHRCDP